eukprot:6490860-Amphidinium_carterae.2
MLAVTIGWVSTFTAQGSEPLVGTFEAIVIQVEWLSMPKQLEGVGVYFFPIFSQSGRVLSSLGHQERSAERVSSAFACITAEKHALDAVRSLLWGYFVRGGRWLSSKDRLACQLDSFAWASNRSWPMSTAWPHARPLSANDPASGGLERVYPHPKPYPVISADDYSRSPCGHYPGLLEHPKRIVYANEKGRYPFSCVPQLPDVDHNDPNSIEARRSMERRALYETIENKSWSTTRVLGRCLQNPDKYPWPEQMDLYEGCANDDPRKGKCCGTAVVSDMQEPVVCCRHSRYTPKAGWNPRAGYPGLESFPIELPRQGYWQDVNNILTLSTTARPYCQGYGPDGVYRNLTQADVISLARSDQNRRGGVLISSVVYADDGLPLGVCVKHEVPSVEPTPNDVVWDARHMAEHVKPYALSDPESEGLERLYPASRPRQPIQGDRRPHPWLEGFCEPAQEDKDLSTHQRKEDTPSQVSNDFQTALYETIDLANPDDCPWPGAPEKEDQFCENEDPTKGPMNRWNWDFYCSEQAELRSFTMPPEEKMKYYFCYICRKRGKKVRNPDWLIDMFKCLICEDVYMCAEHSIQVRSLESVARICCRHTRYTPSRGSWNPKGGYPKLNGVPSIPKQERLAGCG